VLVRDRAAAGRASPATPRRPAAAAAAAAMQSPYLPPAMDLTPYSYNRTMAEYFHSCKSESVTHARTHAAHLSLSAI